jgi:predicted nucleic acid-binding protein
VDSNVLIDVMTADSEWLNWSTTALRAAANHGRLIINTVIFAEISVGFDRMEEVEAALPPGVIEREAIPDAAAFLAAKVFVTYRRRGGTRRSPLPDFFIGAHAAIGGYHVLTRDTARYQTYFPALNLISPT